MKKWPVRAAMIGILCMSIAGCGKNKTGSELLTQTEAALEPVEEEIVPAVEETDEGIALHIYTGDDEAENIIRTTVYVEEVDEQVVMSELVAALGMGSEAGLNSFQVLMHNGDRVARVDLNQSFADYLNRLGTAGEYIVMGSLTNTFLECYQCELMLVTAEGKVLETGHAIYEEYLEMYPYIEAEYRVTETILEADGLYISCPQIEGLGDERIQEKWNAIILENEQRAVDGWEGGGTYQVSFTVKTMSDDLLSILLEGNVYSEGEAYPSTFLYTYNIDLNTGKSVRLCDQVDVDQLAENLFAGVGYYVEESLKPYFVERLESIYEDPDALARSLEGYDYSEDESEPYGYSYISSGRVWLCMEVPHSLGDYIEIELDAVGN